MMATALVKLPLSCFLLSKSILVTAGHCVYDTAANKYITAGTFFPARVNCNGGGALVTP